jgi:hypothetical protein
MVEEEGGGGLGRQIHGVVRLEERGAEMSQAASLGWLGYVLGPCGAQRALAVSCAGRVVRDALQWLCCQRGGRVENTEGRSPSSRQGAAKECQQQTPARQGGVRGTLSGGMRCMVQQE